MSHSSLTILVSVLSALLAVHWVYFKVLAIAKLKNLVDNPDARKLQKTPVPVMGGISVFFGFIVGIAASVIYNSITGSQLLIPRYTIIAALSVMLYVGAIDDMLGLTARTRFIIEILTILALIGGLGACVDSLHGLWGIGSFSWWIGVPLTVFAGVGIINAINMIDGVNGLSSSLCILCNICFGIAFVQSDQLYHAIINFTMAGALIPFFCHNVFGRSSKMYIGDAGTMVMGTLMAYDVIQVLRSDTATEWMQYANQGMCLVALTFAILAVPVLDTIRVMTLRMLKGHSPFEPDRTHLHHKWLDYTYSHFMTMVCELLTAIAIIVVWAIAYMLGAPLDVQFYITLGAGIVLVWGEYAFFVGKLGFHTGLAYRFRKYLANNRVEGEKAWWNQLQRFVDSGERYDLTDKK